MAREKCDVDLSFLPIKLQQTLMPFQKEGIKFAIRKNGRCLIADEMGLGKTLQALCVAYYYHTEWPLLIVVPSSLRYPWIEELERWLPQIHPHSINLIQNGGDISDISRASITIVTYGLLRHPASRLVQEALSNQRFEVVIVDESHYIKNRKSAGTKFLVPLLQSASHKLLLSGTPALARPDELFPQLDALCPGKFGRWTEFSLKYCDAKWQYFGRQRRKWSTGGASNLEELHTMMASKVMIRRLKKNVLSQLPPKQRQRIAFELKDSQLKKELDRTWEDLHLALGRNQMTVTSYLSSKVVMQQEQTSSSRIYRLLGEMRNKTCTAKIGPVKDYIKMLCENADLKLLVFAHYHIMMDSISELLSDLSIKFIRIDGKTPHQDRPRLVDQFQRDVATRVAVLNMRAAGVGITLTAAQLVLFAELDWTPGVLEQCEDRAHRIGQHNTVHVHYLVAKGTLDEWMWSAISRKTTVITTTLNGETEVLQMAGADTAAQVECLASACPFVPRDDSVTDGDLPSFFQATQTPTGQKSVLDYFTSSCKRKLDNIPSPGEKSRKRDSGKSRQRHDSSVIVLLDSDSDENSQFKPTKLDLRMPQPEQAADGVGSFDLWSSDEESRDEVEHNNGCTVAEVISSDVLRSDMDDMMVKEKDGKLSNQGEKPTWRCKLCTFENHRELSFCEMCNSPKAKKEKSFGNPSRKIKGRGSLGVGKTRMDGKPSTAQTVDSRCANSVTCERVNASAMVDMVSVACPPVVAATGYIPVCDHSPRGNCGDGIYTQASSNTDHVTESHSVEITDNASELHSHVDPSTSDNESDVCCTNHTNNVKKSKNENKHVSHHSHDAVGASQIHRTSDASCITDEHRISGEDTDVHDLFPDECNDISDWSDDSCGENLTSQNSNATSDFSHVSGTQKSGLGTRKEHEMSDSSESSDLSQQDAETEKIGVNPALSIATNDNVTGNAPGHNLNAEGTRTSGHCGERTEEMDEALLDKDYGDEGATDDKLQQMADTRVVNIDDIVTYSAFHYCCSKNTSRIFLYDHTKEALNVNFVPLDVEMSNYGELADLLLHPANLRIVRRFLRQWNSLASNKRRVIVKSGEIFLNPCLLYEELKSGQKTSKQRYTTKADVAAVTLSKAVEVGGSVRVISRSTAATSTGTKRKHISGASTSISGGSTHVSPDDTELLASLTEALGNKSGKRNNEIIIENVKGILQAVDAEGIPLCVNCQQPYNNELVGLDAIRENSWQTRFCCRDCMQQYWMKTNRGYSVQQVFESEHGVCQLCQFAAHEFFLLIKNCSSLHKRARLIQESCYKVLKKDIKDRMVKQPQKGLFWNVDHITPVADGGGECDVDNLRTLCTVCHRDITARQNKERSKEKRRQLMAKCGDITAFFPVQ